MKRDGPAAFAARPGQDLGEVIALDGSEHTQFAGESQDAAAVGGISGERLRSFIERIERLEEERRTIAADIKEVFAEAKGSGFDTKIMRQIIKIRRMDKDDLAEQEALLDIYKRALGMLADTPLGEAAVAGEIGREAGRRMRQVKANIDAQEIGKRDGSEGHRKHAHKYPTGTYGHADYELGHAAGELIADMETAR